MKTLRRWLNRFRSRTRTIDREVDEEIRFHLEMRTAANIDAGMNPEAARRRAESSFGSTERVRRAGREILAEATPSGGRGWWAGLLRDARFAIRTLRSRPLPTVVAVLSLALGIGANAANFSIAYGVLYRPLPFASPERIVHVDTANPERGVQEGPLTWADLDALRETGVFEGLAGLDTRSVTVTGDERPERIAAASITPGLFAVLGVQPARGRWFEAEEGSPAGFEEVVIISDGLWKRLFGADPEILGRNLHLNGRELVIVGVMPPGFGFPERQDLWLPLGTEDPTDRDARFMTAVGRLAPGVTLEQASAAAAAVGSRFATLYPDTHEDWRIRVQTYRAGVVNPLARQMMLLLLAAVGLVLLLACANVANLMLARATERGRELAVRAALGAGRGRLVRQMLTEAVLLGLVGGALGLLIAHRWIRWAGASVPDDLAYWMQISLDTPVLAYTAVVTLGTALLFGILPALQGSRAGVGASLRDGGRGGTDSASRGRLRGMLVAGEVALAVVLLVSASLMVQSFLMMQEADPGFDPDPVLSFRVLLSGDQYDDPAARAAMFRGLNARLAALPGAAAAVVTSAIPADDGGPPVTVAPPGAPEREALTATAVLSTDGLFEALGVRPLAGRDFTTSEMADGEARVAILGETLAARLWGQKGALGRAVHIPEFDADFTVIGIAPDFKYEEFGEGDERSELQLHLPYALGSWRGMSVLARADGDPATLIGPARDALAALDPTQAAYDVYPMTQRRRATMAPQRLLGESFALFGAIALLLAFCGVYAVIAYSVSRRTREMGVRIALGAQPADVRRQVVAGALRLAAIGLGIGLIIALGFSRAMQGLLFGVGTADPTTFVGVVVTIALAAGLAGWVPARRASRVDPTEALRAD